MAFTMSASTRTTFYALAVLATILLQGVFIADGAFAALNRHAQNGRFSDGKQLHHVYLGLPIIDHMLRNSVSMWDPVCNSSPSVKLLSIDFSTTVQSLGVFAVIESLRRGKGKNILLRWAPVNIFLWQTIGAANFIPLYLAFELDRHFHPHPHQKKPSESDPSVPYLKAKSFLPAAVITIIHCYWMVYFPPSGITTSQHQVWLAIWQLAPFFCWALDAALASYLESDPADDNKNSKEASANQANPHADALYLKATYFSFGLFCASMHLWVLYNLTFSKDPSLSLSSAFIPRNSKLWYPNTGATNWVEESRYFLQWDYIIVVLAAGLYALVITEGTHVRAGKFSTSARSAIFSAFCIACVMFSPGSVCAWVLYWREDFLRRRCVEQYGHQKQNGRSVNGSGNGNGVLNLNEAKSTSA